MRIFKCSVTRFLFNSTIAAIIVIALISGCNTNPAWKAENDRIIREHGVNLRQRADIPKSAIVSNLAPGQTVKRSSIATIESSPGVTRRLIWGTGVLVSMTTLAPGAEILEETLPAERLAMVVKGSVNESTGDGILSMSALGYEKMTPVSGHRERNDLLLLDKGMKSVVKAGPEGAELIELFSPIPDSFLKAAGVSAGSQPDTPVVTPSIAPGTVTDLYTIPFTMLSSTEYARIIDGYRMQTGFLRIDPVTETGFQCQPEERLAIVLRGSADMTTAIGTNPLETGDAFLIPSGMVCSLATGAKGLDILEVWWPGRPDYTAAMNAQATKFHAVVPADSRIELVVDGAVSGPGLCYCEGPSWIKGKLYFSSMGYDNIWTGDPANSRLIEMDPDGAYRYKSKGMELNGTFPMANGNLAICDMFNHRVIEMTTGGKVVRVIADKYDGKRIDGPNDLAVDDKGGVYFSDPQILPEPYFQPGKSVFYARPDGSVIRVMDPGTLIKPNGLILSPDQKTLYVNSTHENFMLAYDVQPDGSTTNPRKFGKVLLTPEILDQESINPQTDGMTVDEMGNVYITSMLGLQIFSPSGEYLGYIHFPLMPVNCCFGGEDGKTLYVTCNDKVYRVRMNVKGAAYTLRGM